MNQKYFLAVMSIRSHANHAGLRVKSVEMLDETGLIYQVNYFTGDFQQFRIGMDTKEIVYITELDQTM